MKAMERYFPWVLLVLVALAMGAAMKPRLPQEPYDLAAFARLPVVYDGRVKPMEAVARNTLLVLRNRQALRVENRQLSAVEWLLEVMARQEQAQEYPVFRIDEPGLRNLLSPNDADRNVFSFNQILVHGQTLTQQMSRAFNLEPAQRDPYQRKLLELSSKLTRYTELAHLESIFMLPPAAQGQEWLTLEQARQQIQAGQPAHPAFHWMGRLLAAYHHKQPAQFNATLQEYQQWLNAHHPDLVQPARLEATFVQTEIFYYGLIVYALAFLLVCASWLGWSQPLLRSAVGIATLAFLLHTIGMIARMVIHGRPPVTNLYASALFVGWGCVLLSLIIERLYRNGVGVLLAGLTGFLSLLVAHNLAEGDTLEAMRAVLDNNFWLATHVVVITIGYSCMFLAGFLSILYIFRRLFARLNAPDELAASMGKMVYGILCFALLMSFVGTVLGGIWADQSWGRFWGWDPKENGALLIVLWCALILHARWGGLVKTPGIMILAVFGNVVTAWSWFGVNMMGVGLHSYGFMDQALLWLGIFVASQFVIMALGLIPIIRQANASSTPA